MNYISITQRCAVLYANIWYIRYAYHLNICKSVTHIGKYIYIYIEVYGYRKGQSNVAEVILLLVIYMHRIFRSLAIARIRKKHRGNRSNREIYQVLGFKKEVIACHYSWEIWLVQSGNLNKVTRTLSEKPNNNSLWYTACYIFIRTNPLQFNEAYLGSCGK